MFLVSVDSKGARLRLSLVESTVGEEAGSVDFKGIREIGGKMAIG